MWFTLEMDHSRGHDKNTCGHEYVRRNRARDLDFLFFLFWSSRIKAYTNNGRRVSQS